MIPDEHEAIKRCLAGDTDAFRLLYEASHARVRALVSRMLHDGDAIEDTVQEAFIRAYSKLHLFRGRCSFARWVCSIAVNTAKRHRSSLARAPLLLSDDELNDALNQALRTDTLDEKVTTREAVRTAISKLPPRLQYVLILRFYDGLSHREIAQVLGCTETTARTTLHSAPKPVSEEPTTLEGISQYDVQTGRTPTG